MWQRVQESGAYRFSADIVQTTTPQTTIANAGRASRQTQLYMEGESDSRAETLRLSLWSQGGSVMDPNTALEIRVDGTQAMARSHRTSRRTHSRWSSPGNWPRPPINPVATTTSGAKVTHRDLDGDTLTNLE